MKHLAPRFRLIHLLLLCIAMACQGRGRVHEAPPASLPDADPGATARGVPSPPAPTLRHEANAEGEGYATPPPPPSSPAPPALEQPSAPHDAQAETSATLGRGQATTDALAPRHDGGRGPMSKRPSLEQRPGLATHWGEARYSPARQVDFERSDAERPSAIIELHYDDRDGARRLLPRGEWGRAEAWVLGGLRVSIVDSSGQPLPALRSGARVVGVGAPGERYALAVENSTGARVEVVASVDGLDVLDGESASFEKRGYLIAAYSSVLIDGFRRSDAEVAAFRLGDVARSYAASKGQARNVGVIGFAVFEERRAVVLEPAPRWRDRSSETDTRQRREADAFPGRYARPPVW